MDSIKQQNKQQNTPNKSKSDSVIGKKKRGIVFKDTVASPYLSKSINTISIEYSDKIINSLKELNEISLNEIKSKRETKKQSYLKIKNEKKALKKIENRLKSINTKKEFILKDTALTTIQKNEQIEKQNALHLDFTNQKNNQQSTVNSLLKIQKEQQQTTTVNNNNDKEQQKDNRLNQLWIGVNKITREMEKNEIHSPPSIRCIIVCPNPDVQILTSHLPIMAYMRRIPICLLPKEYSIPLSQSVGISKTVLAIAIKENSSGLIDKEFDEKFEDFVKLSVEASKSIDSLDFPWLPQKYTNAHLSESLDFKYIPSNIIKEGNKRIKHQ